MAAEEWPTQPLCGEVRGEDNAPAAAAPARPLGWIIVWWAKLRDAMEGII